jgi:hypothetical protein
MSKRAQRRAQARRLLPLATALLVALWFGAVSDAFFTLFPPRRLDPKLGAMDIAEGLARIADTEPDLWPSGEGALLLSHSLRKTLLHNQSTVEACRSAIWAALAPDQHDAMPSLAAVAGDMPGGSNLYADPILHGALRGLIEIGGSPGLARAPDLSKVQPREDLNTLSRGLLVLVRQGMLSRHQASMILPPCLEAELSLRQRRDSERQLGRLLDPKTRAWIEEKKARGELRGGFQPLAVTGVLNRLSGAED